MGPESIREGYCLCDAEFLVCRGVEVLLGGKDRPVTMLDGKALPCRGVERFSGWRVRSFGGGFG